MGKFAKQRLIAKVRDIVTGKEDRPTPRPENPRIVGTLSLRLQ